MNLKISLLLFFLTVTLYVNGQVNLEFDKEDSTDTLQPTLIAIPDSRGFINDRERIFSEVEFNKLITYMRTQKMDSTQITILTIPSLNPFNSLEDLATRYANMWNLGSEKKNGVMIVLSKELKKSRLQVGEGLKKKFTDEVRSRIDNVMIPEFIKGDYFSGVIKGLQKVNSVLKEN